MAEAGGGGDLLQETLGAEGGGQLWAEDLEGDLALVLEILSEVHRGHPAPVAFALDAVAVGEAAARRGGTGDSDTLPNVGHLQG